MEILSHADIDSLMQLKSLGDYDSHTQESVYLRVEKAIRDGRYSDVDNYIQDVTDPGLKLLCQTYRDLFTNTTKASESLKSLFKIYSSSSYPITFRRLCFWNAHLKVLLGSISDSEKLYRDLVSNGETDSLWSAEENSLAAIFFYLSGQPEEAKIWHVKALEAMKTRPDIFLTVFNSAMAMRTAIKLADAGFFDDFLSELENHASETELKRYRLRQFGYRAVILAQNGDISYSKAYWDLADKHLLNNESPFEAGQYLILRAIGAILSNDESPLPYLERAKEEFAKVNPEGPYQFEIELAEIFTEIGNPLKRGRSLLNSVRLITEAREKLVLRKLTINSQLYPNVEEALGYCDHILNSDSSSKYSCKYSLVLSVLENSSIIGKFDSANSHNRALPIFVKKVATGDFTEESIVDALSSTLKQRVAYSKASKKLSVEDKIEKKIPEIEAMLVFAESLIRLKNELEDKTISASLVELARQVSHDIRSPLSALDVFLMTLENIPDDNRTMARLAISRIKDIANSLLKPKIPLEIADSSKRTLISSLVEELISEKRIQFRDIYADIDLILAPDSYEAFSEVNPAVLKRVISNIVNNAVEAIDKRNGVVQVSLVADSSYVNVVISDNGKGFPQEVLDQIGKKPFSYGKDFNQEASGSGLGLFHACNAISDMGGSIKIESCIGKGTIVKIHLPRSVSPEWFPRCLDLKEIKNVIVVDDDISIHQIWNNRIKSATPQINLIGFTSPLELFHENSIRDFKDCLFLVDYEFLNSSISGIDIITRLGISKTAILVTSHYSELEQQEVLKKYSLRCLPKNLVGLVPITGVGQK